MNPVACIAYGGTKFSKTGTAKSHMIGAVQNLFASAPELERADIDGVLVATNENSKYLAAQLSESMSLSPKYSHTVENLCSSGSNAIVSACAHIMAGLADLILVAGTDEVSGPGQVFDDDVSRGRFSKPAYWASLYAASYKRKFGASPEQIASVSAKNHTYASENPLAMHMAKCTINDVLGSRQITGDLHLYECSRTCTGASAVLLGSQDAVRRIKCQKPAWICGIGQKSDSASVSCVRDFSVLHSAFMAAHDAMNMAKIRPKDVNVAEVHDAFAVCEPMAVEAVGICEKGKGALFSNEMYDTDNRMINPRGGIIGSGHPLGATGVAQVAEIAAQLADSAGPRQVSGAKVGIVHNMSAAATSSTVLVLQDEL